MMNGIKRMSDAEKEVMQLIWADGGPFTSARLIDALKKKGSAWKTSTVMTFLGRLVDKGILTSVKCGRSFEYIPKVSESEYRQFETQLFLDSVHDGSVTSLFAALFDGHDMSSDEIDALKAWFSERSGGK
jgi:BlaI family penicillinase repressor